MNMESDRKIFMDIIDFYDLAKKVVSIEKMRIFFYGVKAILHHRHHLRPSISTPHGPNIPLQNSKILNL